MKKIIALLLALIMTLSIFTACGEEKKPAGNEPSTDVPDEPTNPDTPADPDEPTDPDAPADPDTPANPDEPTDPVISNEEKETDKQLQDVPYDDKREFASAVQEALVVTAEAFFERGKYLQYDDSSLVKSTTLLEKNIRRPDRLKHNPEDANSQFTWYTNCASWTYDVYYRALGIDIVDWTTLMLHEDTEIQVWSHTVVDAMTDAQRAKTFEEFSSKLQPGDILCCRHKYGNGGHALLYIGDGQILHSAAGHVANYDYTKMTEYFEEEGTVMRKTLDSLMDTDDKYYFFGEKWWGIIRPTLRHTDAKPTEETVNRVNNMQKIYAEKLTTATVGHTVKAGDEITYTFSIENRRETDTVVEIVENLSGNVTLVNGGIGKVEGTTIKWTVGIPAGETRTRSFTVKVKDGVKVGDVIESVSTVDGVNVNCRPVYIGGSLSAEQQAKIAEELGKVTAATGVYDTDFAEQIYAAAGITIDIEKGKDIVNSLLTPFMDSKTHYALNSESPYINMVAPTLYGGYYTVTDTERWGGYRTKGMLSCQLMIGDILICVPKVGKTVICMYAGEGKLFTISSLKFGMQDVEETNNILTSALGYNRFVVIRPAMAQ